ncbi:DUF4389 domain-containing protein [Candidatus Venteria ishoeyi]|uniref:DUF4389 domain-containing protein n=1 Tax=Candidatus Venteria ishoeyi TaxID=1899563 RepID=UPI0025A4E074|nr:DUF4389 domain-containing protein [Candidatus Venteria ishoeyi]MDM8546034.1 DUF4389 domain-containing protein [Candidatus Venteria ishoeyi]
MKDHILFFPTWVRGFFLLLFLVIYSVARIVILTIIIFQFGSLLFTGKVNERLLEFGEHLSIYSYQIIRYLTFNTEEKPFPFRSWPKSAQAPIEVVEPTEDEKS